MDVATDEIERSRAQGLLDVWEVAEDYEITAGMLRRKGGPRRQYSPMRHPEIPSKLAKLRRGDEAGLLAFARTYGGLGFSALVPPERRCGGDPLPWIWAHAETLRMCRELLLVLPEKDEERDVDRLAAYLRSLQLPDSLRTSVAPWLLIRDDQEQWPVGMVAEGAEIVWRNWAALGTHMERRSHQGREIDGLTEHVCKAVIRANIVGISPEPADIGGEIRLCFRFRALIETAYWHLEEVMQAGHVGLCKAKDCGVLFVQTDLREQYCPPPFGRGKSLCANRERQRRHYLQKGK